MMKRQKYDARQQLEQLGMEPHHAKALLRISNTLHRWHELECGTDAGAIARDEETGGLLWYNNRTHRWQPYEGRDHERSALRRLAYIMSQYGGLSYYVQGDPRGCALYVLRQGDVPEGADPSAYYPRGIAVYKE